jgi:hypothetical protein
METVLLKSKYGSTGFKRRTKVQYERGFTYEMKEYPFSFDNDFKCSVPKEIWDELEYEWFDRKFGLKYKDAFQTL